MALDVTVNIKLAEVVGKAGTWFPCLYVVNSELSNDAYHEYKNFAELAAAYETETEVYKAANILFMQDNPPNKIAVLEQSVFSADTMVNYLGEGWRQLVLVGTHANVAEIAAYIETTDKMLFVTEGDASKLATLYTSVKSYDRTFIVCHPDANAAAAVVGATAGLSAGSFTYKNMKIKGIAAEDLTAAEIEAIHEKGAISIVEKVGDVVTTDGVSASGEYTDIVDGKDYIVQNIIYNTQKVLNNNNKVPYTNAGISMLESAILEALKDAYNNGLIADNEDGTPAYNTSFALRSETTENDRATRNYPYGAFSFTLSGAVHTVEVNGTISI